MIFFQNWSRKRHEIRDLAGGVFTARTASEAIYQLEQALEKEGRASESEPPADVGLSQS